ncbi:MAG: hypothetical protein IJ079_04610 [Lachnospiraceae bacterium]|nr:hypothetical protein [Lachnospiraceae bacterium]
MNISIIIVMLIGIICIIVSFVFVGRDADSGQNSDDVGAVTNHITEEYELNEDEVAILQKKVSDKISNDVTDILNSADQELATMSNEKMLALGDYAVTVCDEIEKNHKEVMFLYSMLNDKEKELKDLVGNAERKASELRKANELAMESYVAAPSGMVSIEELEFDSDPSLEEQVADEGMMEPENTNDIILEMKRSGMSILEIARQLGLGVGEVKLVVDLYM